MSSAKAQIGGGGRVRLVASAKPDGGVRWIAHLDPATASRYARATARVAARIERALAPTVVADRVVAPGSVPLRLEPWRMARRRYRAAVLRMTTHPTLALADVRDCFGSITPDLVASRLADLGCEADDRREIADVLWSLAEDGVRGLPVGPAASGVLTNAVLHAADLALARRGTTHVRWVDDFLIAAPDRATAGASVEVLGSALGSMGLSLSEPKTRLLEEGGPPMDPSGFAARL